MPGHVRPEQPVTFVRNQRSHWSGKRTSQAWVALEPVVRSKPAFARWIEEFRALKDGTSNSGAESARRQVALREALNGAVALLGVVHGSRMDYAELAAVERMENRRFPLLAREYRLRTAGCGPACPVVWQGRAGDRAPYADR